jgi:hypothetical protein
MLVLSCGIGTPVWAQESAPQPDPPIIVTGALPKAVLRHSYEHKLESKGGTPPLSWGVATGELPPGLELHSDSGVIGGSPTSTGTFYFTVRVADAAKPSRSHLRELMLRVFSPLEVEWKSAPSAETQGIAGSIEISNHTSDDFDLTFIVLAVNEIGKAFVLGYEHFTLSAGIEQRQIAFGSNLPRGRYVVHADAVAEIPAKLIIYRSRLESSALPVP